MPIPSYFRDLVLPAPRTDDPKNWPRSKKNVVVFIIAYCAFVGPLASSIYMPAVLQVKQDLNTTSSLVSATLSIYVLFMGIMPVFWASLCEYYGRRPIYLSSMLIFILGSLCAALSKNIWVFFVMRAIQAFGSSSVLSVGGGSLSDVFHSGERGSAFGLFYLGPLVAPMIGPIIGGVLADKAGWR
ncbi:major facilitator superfamily domain-containing protein [Gamsiella multidivaricata]|uniref:major facilitator superfamily domain-containing protein n=1 Tax=Gamsiella multidivaricata TaxID=101098 RepID=UPI00221F8C5E|nr:major facilitator superfamily domain-containing protein [Gamsiella multidivaricata]KAI7815774.1 major facilitator superfamily domain-containing protein [Gamsiella multidivaricata]